MKIVKLLLAALFSFLLLDPGLVTAQGNSHNSDWSEPLLLFDDPGWKGSTGTALLATPDGIVHAFWQSDPSRLSERDQTRPGSDNLWYTQIAPNRTPFEPVNILVAPPDGAIQRSVKAVVDNQNQVHVFRYSGCLLHSIVSLQEVFLPQEWLKRTACVAETNDDFEATTDSVGQLHLAYPTAQGRLLYRQYPSGAEEWTEPTVIFDFLEGVFPMDSSIAVDSSGTIHVAWSAAEAPDFYPPTGIFYSQSADAGLTWAEPEILAGEGHVEPQITITSDQIVHLVWNGAATIQNRYHRFSNDLGVSWSEIHTFDIPGGILGKPAVAVDSLNRLHAAFSGTDGLYYASWTENMGWSTHNRIRQGRNSAAPAMAITLGNQLHVIFVDRASQNWYMTKTLDAPEIPVTILEDPIIPAAETAIEATPSSPRPPSSITQTIDHDTAQWQAFENDAAAGRTSPTFTLLLSVSITVLFIISVLGIQRGALRRGS